MAKAPERITRKDLLDSMSLSLFNGKIEDVITGLRVFQVAHTALGYFDIELSVDYDYEDTDVYAYGYRNETDLEYEERTKRDAENEAKRKEVLAKQDAAEREMYEKLKRKFGNG